MKAAWWADTGDRATAKCLATGDWLLAAPSGAGQLPGRVYDLGNGWIVFDERTLVSLRVRRIRDDGGLQILRGPAGEEWAVLPAGHSLRAVLDRHGLR